MFWTKTTPVIIYMAVNKVNGGSYIGATSKTLAARHYGIRDHVIHGICSGISKKTKSGLIFKYEDSHGAI